MGQDVVSKTGEAKNENQVKRVNVICSRNTIDGVYPPLIIAINAAREGADAKIFFTFAGLDIVLKKNYEKGYKNVKYFMPGFLGAIPGMTKLATWMMKKKIDEINLPDVKDLIDMARLEGVEFIACHMTMEMMGLTSEDILDNCEIMDANQYMRLAISSDINMFT